MNQNLVDGIAITQIVQNGIFYGEKMKLIAKKIEHSIQKHYSEYDLKILNLHSNYFS